MSNKWQISLLFYNIKFICKNAYSISYNYIYKIGLSKLTPDIKKPDAHNAHPAQEC